MNMERKMDPKAEVINAYKSKIDNLEFDVKELKQYVDHQQKLIAKLQNERKKLQLEYRALSNSTQSFKDKIEELENELDAVKETA